MPTPLTQKEKDLYAPTPILSAKKIPTTGSESDSEDQNEDYASFLLNMLAGSESLGMFYCYGSVPAY